MPRRNGPRGIRTLGTTARKQRLHEGRRVAQRAGSGQTFSAQCPQTPPIFRLDLPEESPAARRDPGGRQAHPARRPQVRVPGARRPSWARVAAKVFKRVAVSSRAVTASRHNTSRAAASSPAQPASSCAHLRQRAARTAARPPQPPASRLASSSRAHCSSCAIAKSIAVVITGN